MLPSPPTHLLLGRNIFRQEHNNHTILRPHRLFNHFIPSYILSLLRIAHPSDSGIDRQRAMLVFVAGWDDSSIDDWHSGLSGDSGKTYHESATA